MIKPTVGRVVWYTPTNQEEIGRNGSAKLAAIVTCVWSDTCVNLAVFGANGTAQNRTSVLLLQDDAAVPDGGYYCEWMPYQIGQAKKNEEDVLAPAPMSHPGWNPNDVELKVQCLNITQGNLERAKGLFAWLRGTKEV